MRDEEKIQLKTGFDKPTTNASARDLRHLVITLTAPDLREAKNLGSLNLALVVDASGSMAGAKLEAAQRGAAEVIEQLAPTDTVSLVSFANDVIVHADRVRAEGEPKARAISQCRELYPRGMTHLSGGWLQGAECAASVMATSPQTLRNHIVLLSDGHANHGIVDPDELGRHARELGARSLTSSCVGIGEGYSTHQLEAIAEHGGGRLHHADNASAIVECVLGELDDVRATAAQDVTVDIRIPKGVAVEVASACPHERKGDRLICRLGSILEGRERDLVISMLVDPARIGTEFDLEISARWRHPDDDRTTAARRFGPITTRLRAVSESEDRAQPRDQDLALRAARAWLANIVQRLVEFNRSGLLTDAQLYYAAQAKPFIEHCTGLPEAESLLREFEHAVPLTQHREQEMALKERHIRHYKMRRGEIDKRRRRL